MKFLISILSGLCLSYPLWQRGAAQYFADPTLNFKPITFDSVLRGSYNISDCIKDHMNCWEIIKPDLICDYWGTRNQDSICTMMRGFCEDYGGEQGDTADTSREIKMMPCMW